MLLAVALTIRPQVAALIPAYWFAIDETTRPTGEAVSRFAMRPTLWTMLVLTLAAIGLIPLIRAGVLGDFWQSIKGVAYGSTYNKVSGLTELGRRLLGQFYEPRLRLLAPLLILFGAGSLRFRDRRLALTWGIARSERRVLLPSQSRRPWLPDASVLGCELRLRGDPHPAHPLSTQPDAELAAVDCVASHRPGCDDPAG